MKSSVKGMIKPALLTILFISIFLFIFFYIQDIFELKGSGYGKYSYYNSEEDNSVNVLFMGNSRTNRAIDPIAIDKIAGTYSYNYAIQGLRANHVYFRLLDALKTQTPKLTVIESSIYLPSKEKNEEAYIHRTLISLPTSPFKVWAANELGLSGKMKIELVLPLLRLHSRYREIASVDFLYLMDRNPDYPYKLQISEETMATHRGYTPYQKDKSLDDDGNNSFDKDYSYITEIGTPEPEADRYFRDMVKTAKEKGSKILILSIPSIDKDAGPEDTIPIMNYLEQLYADDEDVQLLDLWKNVQDVGLDYKNYHNEGHVNRSGAKRISKYVGKYIEENYSFD